jgi:hypothetical protein
MSKTSELKIEYDSIVKNYSSTIWSAFLEDLKDLFKRNPNINSFSTPCYANYFNDGDACPFYVHSYLSEMDEQESDKDEEDEDEDDENYYENILEYKNSENGDYTRICPEKYLPLEEYVNLIECVPEHLLEEKCSDGQIVFYRNGDIKIEDYSHD